MLLNLTLAKFTLTLTFSMEVKGLLKSVFVGVLCYGTDSLWWLWDRLVPSLKHFCPLRLQSRLFRSHEKIYTH